MNYTFIDGFVDRCQSKGVAPSALLKQAGVGAFLGRHDYLRSGLLGAVAAGVPGAFTATGPLDAYGRETAPSFSDRVAKMMKGLLLGGIAGVGLQAAMPYDAVRKRIAEKNAAHGDKMNKRAFEQGYSDRVKQAVGNDSNWLGRYLATKGIRPGMQNERPWRTMVGNTLGLGGLALGVPNAIGEYGLSLDKRKELLDKVTSDPMSKSYGEMAMHGAGNWVGPGAVVGGVAGTIGGGVLGGGLGSIVGMGVGAGVGALAGLSQGALNALLQKLILRNVSRSSVSRAAQLKQEHPLLSALPFGDMIGAAKY